MEREQISSRLHTLLENLLKKEKEENNIDEFSLKISNEKTRPIQKLKNFDFAYKDRFVTSKVGEKPDEPAKGLLIALCIIFPIYIPIYLRKIKRYETELKQYQAAVSAAEIEYYSKFEKDRKDLLDADNQEREVALHELTLKLAFAKENLDKVVCLIENEDIVGPSLKNIPDVQTLIDIFDNRRADTMKEAINVMFEDKHRERMEELQEEQVRLAEEVREAAKNAANSADEATKIAKEALNRAEDAYYQSIT